MLYYSTWPGHNLLLEYHSIFSFAAKNSLLTIFEVKPLCYAFVILIFVKWNAWSWVVSTVSTKDHTEIETEKIITRRSWKKHVACPSGHIRRLRQGIGREAGCGVPVFIRAHGWRLRSELVNANPKEQGSVKLHSGLTEVVLKEKALGGGRDWWSKGLLGQSYQELIFAHDSVG